MGGNFPKLPGLTSGFQADLGPPPESSRDPGEFSELGNSGNSVGRLMLSSCWKKSALNQKLRKIPKFSFPRSFPAQPQGIFFFGEFTGNRKSGNPKITTPSQNSQGEFSNFSKFFFHYSKGFFGKSLEGQGGNPKNPRMGNPNNSRSGDPKKTTGILGIPSDPKPLLKRLGMRNFPQENRENQPGIPGKIPEFPKFLKETGIIGM